MLGMSVLVRTIAGILVLLFLSSCVYIGGKGGRDLTEKEVMKLHHYCDANEPEFCVALAEYYKGHQKFDLHEKYYLKACEEAILGACVEMYLDDRQSKNANIDKQLYYLKKACDGGNIRGCSYLGLLYSRGEKVERDLDQAILLLTIACEKRNVSGHQLGCHRLANTYLKRNRSTEDIEAAKKLFRYACNSELISSCEELANVYKAENRKFSIVEYFQAACDENEYIACNTLGNFYNRKVTYKYSEIDFLKTNYVKADLLYQKACNGGVLVSCKHFASRYHRAGIKVEQIKALLKACTPDSDLTCDTLGFKYLSGEGVPKSLEQAIYYFEIACSVARNFNSCGALIRLYASGQYTTKNEQKVREFQKRACSIHKRDIVNWYSSSRFGPKPYPYKHSCGELGFL